jgi:hypothetical protein
MKLPALAIFILVTSWSCGTGAAGPPDVSAATGAIVASLPAGWTTASQQDGQLPHGHYWGDWGRDYKAPRGRLVVLSGPEAVSIAWRAGDGVWRQEPIARESLELWFMPAEYIEGLWSRINPHAPEPAARIFSGTKVMAYAMPSHRVVDEPGLKRILAAATETGWPDSPSRVDRVSWSNWQADLQRVLSAGVTK